MKSKLIAVVSGLALVAATGWAFSSQDGVAKAVEDGLKEILTLEQVLPMVGEKYPGRVTEAELEKEDGRMVYEIELLSTDSGKQKLLVDAYTGEVLKARQKD